MKKTPITLLFILVCIVGLSQSDSSGVRNYFGVNISSLAGKVFASSESEPSRIGISYRRCIGLYNLKIAFVGMNNARPQFSYGNLYYDYNDSTKAKLRSSASNFSRDIRIGLERKWGSKRSKLYVGGGLTFGKFVGKESYYRYFYKVTSDSLNDYVADQYYSYETGYDKNTYLKIGVDVWVGIAWDIGEHFNFMIQINPDLSNYNLIKSERKDVASLLLLPEKNFVYLSLSSIDLMLGVRF